MRSSTGGGESGSTGGHIETNRWYDIRIETAGGRIKCFLDGKQIHDVAPRESATLFASATTDKATGEVILKVVNGAHQAQPVEIRIDGTRIADGPAASAVILTSPGAMDENSLDEPEKVAPKPVTVTVKDGRIQQMLDANSFLVIRLKVQR